MSTNEILPDIPAPVAHPSKPIFGLPSLSCDAHAHVFGSYEHYPFSHLRDYTPPVTPLEQYIKMLKQLGFGRAVLVQPSVYGVDNCCMLDALKKARKQRVDVELRGVAVISEDTSDNELLDMREIGVKGVRINLLYKGADSHLQQVKRLIKKIEPLGWHIQFLIDISQTPEIFNLISDSPIPIVFDHCGHFPTSLGTTHSSFKNFIALLQEKNTWVKLSGPNRITSLDKIPFTDVIPIVQLLIENAPDQLVFGTDWPHVKLKTTMPDDGALVDELYTWTRGNTDTLQKVLVDNPARLYGF